MSPAPARFSTVGLPDDERVELWEGHNAEALIGLRCRTLEHPPLEATVTNLSLESLDLARVVGTPHVVERDAALIRRNPSDAVVLYFTMVGDAFFYSEDGVQAIRPGQLLLCDADRAFMRGFSRGLEELVLKMPRAAFRDLTGVTSLADPMVLDFSRAGNVHAEALAQLVSRATRSADPIPPDEQTILELVAVLAVGTRADLNVAHRSAARSFIERHLADPTLSATRVADAIGISPRHLSRVFAADGTSVPQYVMARRLEVARALLERPAAAGTTIAETARRAGFTSATHFSHAFADRFGRRASDVRREAIIARAARAS